MSDLFDPSSVTILAKLSPSDRELRIFVKLVQFLFAREKLSQTPQLPSYKATLTPVDLCFLAPFIKDRNVLFEIFLGYALF